MSNATNPLVTEFILLGFPELCHLRGLLFGSFLTIYVVTVLENLVIVVTVGASRHLHTPMYFFLANLSLLEIGYTCSVIPKMLQSLVSEARGISREGCATQMFFFAFFGISECCLLAAMAFDRYMAICSPLHYATRMSRGVCVHLAMVSWGVGCMVGLGQTNYIFSLDFCGPCEIDHFFCDLPPSWHLPVGIPPIMRLQSLLWPSFAFPAHFYSSLLLMAEF